MMPYHEPVMARESLEMLAIQRDGIYVDATFGGGGHSRLILEALGPKGMLVAFDQDADAAAQAWDDPRLRFVPHNFRHLKRFLRLYGIGQIDGLLADLGVSSHQLDTAERGFSYRFDAPLDMRMNQEEGQPAADILNSLDAASLQELFSRYGEVRNARTLAMKIVETRSGKPFRTVGDLLAVAEPLSMGQRFRYLSQVFQALRIEVNDELGALEELLLDALETLRPGGRLVVISYHSLEDRAVKNFFKTGNILGEVDADEYGHIHRPFQVVTKKALEPTTEEITRNPRARSARLRVAEKSAED